MDVIWDRRLEQCALDFQSIRVKCGKLVLAVANIRTVLGPDSYPARRPSQISIAEAEVRDKLGLRMSDLSDFVHGDAQVERSRRAVHVELAGAHADRVGVKDGREA